MQCYEVRIYNYIIRVLSIVIGAECSLQINNSYFVAMFSMTIICIFLIIENCRGSVNERNKQRKQN